MVIAPQTPLCENLVELNEDFLTRVQGTPGGEKINTCIQCGTCSATCPLCFWMDYTPRQLIVRIRAGLKDDVLNSRTIWVCASCYSCTVACPRGIRIADLMQALKRIAIEDNLNPSRFPIPVLANEFTKMVERHGRVTESWLMTYVTLKTSPVQILGRATFGLQLLWRRRFPLGIRRLKHINLKPLLDPRRELVM